MTRDTQIGLRIALARSILTGCFALLFTINYANASLHNKLYLHHETLSSLPKCFLQLFDLQLLRVWQFIICTNIGCQKLDVKTVQVAGCWSPSAFLGQHMQTPCRISLVFVLGVNGQMGFPLQKFGKGLEWHSMLPIAISVLLNLYRLPTQKKFQNSDLYACLILKCGQGGRYLEMISTSLPGLWKG